MTPWPTSYSWFLLIHLHLSNGLVSLTRYHGSGNRSPKPVHVPIRSRWPREKKHQKGLKVWIFPLCKMSVCHWAAAAKRGQSPYRIQRRKGWSWGDQFSSKSIWRQDTPGTRQSNPKEMGLIIWKGLHWPQSSWEKGVQGTTDLGRLETWGVLRLHWRRL